MQLKKVPKSKEDLHKVLIIRNLTRCNLFWRNSEVSGNFWSNLWLPNCFMNSHWLIIFVLKFPNYLLQRRELEILFSGNSRNSCEKPETKQQRIDCSMRFLIRWLQEKSKEIGTKSRKQKTPSMFGIHFVFDQKRKRKECPYMVGMNRLKSYKSRNMLLWKIMFSEPFSTTTTHFAELPTCPNHLWYFSPNHFTIKIHCSNFFEIE